MIRKKNIYAKPKKSFEQARIQEENELIKKYGLKNKKEIWKTLAKINYFRKRAMALARIGGEEQEIFFNKLKKNGAQHRSYSRCS
jgi:small subunit ribosomal protein S4